MNASTLFASLTSPQGLRRVLWFDAVSGVAIGVMHLAFSGPMADLLGLPVGLLQATGFAIFAYVLLAGWLASRPVPPRGALGLLAAGNFVWAGGCIWLAWGGSPGVSALGVAYLLIQGMAVFMLAELQSVGWRRSGRPALA